jgi:hypothetical protein
MLKASFSIGRNGGEGDNGNGIQTLATAKKMALKIYISSKIDRKSTSSFSRRAKLDLNSVHVRYGVQAVVWSKNRTKNECRER